MIIHLTTTTSTQEEAKRQALAACPHGLVVRADVQTGGRGRRGRTWLSGEHGLWMSMVLRLRLPLQHAPRMSLAACDAVAAAIDEASVFVKWPNDLMVSSTTAHPTLGPFRKIGGMLLEAIETKDGLLTTAILGLGLNLRDPDGGFPDELAASAASLAQAINAQHDDDEGPPNPPMGGLGGPGRRAGRALFEPIDKAELCARLRAALLDVEARCVDDASFAVVRERLIERSATLRRRVSVDGITGQAIGIATDGALQIERDDGVVRAVHAGDVVVEG